MTPLKMIIASLFQLFSIQFGCYFGLFDIAWKTQYTYIIAKYKMYLHLLWNRLQQIVNDSLFYLFLKLVLYINLIFSDNVRILYI